MSEEFFMNKKHYGSERISVTTTATGCTSSLLLNTLGGKNSFRASAIMVEGIAGSTRYNFDLSELGTVDTHATLSTNLTGANNDLTFTAVGYGAAGLPGQSVYVQYLDPGANDAALSVTVSGNTITVNLATDSGGLITTTAAQLKTAYDLVAGAIALATVANKSANDGSGIVTAMAATALSGGSIDSGQILNAGDVLPVAGYQKCSNLRLYSTGGSTVNVAYYKE